MGSYLLYGLLIFTAGWEYIRLNRLYKAASFAELENAITQMANADRTVIFVNSHPEHWNIASLEEAKAHINKLRPYILWFPSGPAKYRLRTDNARQAIYLAFGLKPDAPWPTLREHAEWLGEKLQKVPMTFHAQSDGSKEVRLAAMELVKKIILKEIEKSLTKIELKLYKPVEQDTAVHDMQAVWNQDFLATRDKPGQLPRMGEQDICPAGSYLLEVCYIRQRSGGMGSYYQFDGYFLSLILASDGKTILDARGEVAY